MDHLAVFRDKIGRLRVEITDIQVLNQQFRRDGGNGTGSQLAHGQRSERLKAIQHELVQIADLGRRVVFTERVKERHRSRLRSVKQKRAA
jgi:hypothetical protein